MLSVNCCFSLASALSLGLVFAIAIAITVAFYNHNETQDYRLQVAIIVALVLLYICTLSSEAHGFLRSSLCSETHFPWCSLSSEIFCSENANERTTKVFARPSYR